MRTHILVIAVLVSVVVAPFTAFAVNDVVIQNSVNVTIESPGTTLVIEPVTVDQIVVNTTNVVITMSANGSAVTITSADKYTFTVSGISNPGTSCGASISTLTLPAQTTAVAVTVTPSTICASSVPAAVSLNLAQVPPAPEVPSSTTGNVTATASQGGNTTLTTDEGTTAGVDVPAAALTSDTTFVVSSVAKTSSDVATQVSVVPSGQQIVGNNVYNYTATVAGAILTSFGADITLTFTYTDAQVAGLSLPSLKVHYYDETSGAWVALTTTVDTTTKKITAAINHFTYFAIFGSAEAEVALVDETGAAIVDGDLITTAISFDIYIVKLIGGKKFKRLILNPDIFNSYGHLKWGNVKTVSQQVQDAYTLSELVIEVSPDGSVADPKVYKVSSDPNSDVGQKQWLNMTAAEFIAMGYDWDAIYSINHIEAGPDFYSESTPITA